MEKTKRPYYIALAVLLVAAILLSSAVGGILYKRSKGDSRVSQSNDLHRSFGVGFTDVNVTDEDSAYEAVESVKEDLGISNTRKELHLNVVQNYGKNKYYRMQQYYNDVPVYGRELVIGADKNGKALSLNANYRPLSKSVSTTPKVSGETVRQNVKERASKSYQKVSVPEVSEKQLQYYDFEKGEKTKLAYVVPVKTATETIEMITDADTGEVLEEVAEVPVPNTEVSLVNRGEPGALKVAYTELFAETDGSDREETADPVANGLPAEYRGENWASTTAETDNGNINTNYTVFTHAVTRMLEGAGSSSAAISEEDMIKLLVGALLKFNLDETFQQAADAVYAEAEYLQSTGALTESQQNTVAGAFEEAGLPVTDTVSVSEVAAPEKESKNAETIDVVKTMQFHYGPEIRQASYDYDLDNQILNIQESIVKSFGSEWGDPGPKIGSEDGLIWKGMVQKHPELVLSFIDWSLYDDHLLLAYNPLITSERIKKMRVVIETSDYKSTYEYTFFVEQGVLKRYTEVLIDGDYMSEYIFSYDKKGRVISVKSSGIETIDPWESTVFSAEYRDEGETLKSATLTWPIETNIYTFVFSGEANAKGLISKLNYTISDDDYSGSPITGTVNYDVAGNMKKVEFDDFYESCSLVYDKNERVKNIDAAKSGTLAEYTYQTLKLS